MRRSAAAVALTVIGLWVILSFKTSPRSQPTAVNGTPGSGASASSGSTAPSRPAGSGAGAAAGPPGPGTSTTPPGTAGPGTSTTPPGTAGSGQRTVTGNVFTNHYGPVQVAVVLDGTQIVNVEALQMPTDRARSADISSQAAPLLDQEAVAAQSAHIDTIGGATYTSGSYAQSLQSALDKAHG
jgi:uncharacterized protein with FMN-binding domain